MMTDASIPMHRPEGLSSPVYEMPVTDEELVVLGRIAMIWGQIIFDLDRINLHLMGKTALADLKAYGTQSADRKLGDLHRELSKPENAGIRSSLVSLHRSISAVKADRNVVFHGLWGHWLDEPDAIWKPAAHSFTDPRPFFASDLFALHERMVEVSLAIDEVQSQVFRIFPRPPSERNRRRVWADRPGDTLPPPPPRFVR